MKGLVITGSILLVAIMLVVWGISISNSEIKLRSKVEAQQKSCEAYFDKMWKIISQDAEVAEKYKESFKEIYIPLIEGRYSKGDGTLMKWIQEHNPEFDASLYKKLMNAIEGERNGYFFEQQKLIDINREHLVMLKTFPNSLIVGSRKPIDIVIITSQKTQDIYKVGKEDDIKLF